jgi:hypothetical protein
MLLSLAMNFNWPLSQLDVKNAFLNGDLEEKVFMSITLRFQEGTDKHKACKLKKYLYDLKQSPRAWFEHFGKAIRCHGYHQSQTDHTMFYKHLR